MALLIVEEGKFTRSLHSFCPCRQTVHELAARRAACLKVIARCWSVNDAIRILTREGNAQSRLVSNCLWSLRPGAVFLRAPAGAAPGSTGRLTSPAAVTPEMSIRSTVKVPTAEEIAQLRQNGFTVLDCKSAANLDRTLADS